MPELARVLDVDALDAVEGPCARWGITVPPEWAGSRVTAVLPRRLVCDRCGGGGCDSCSRSGVFKGPPDAAHRTVAFSLPDQAPPYRMRLTSRWAEVELLVIEVQPGEPSAALTRAARSTARPSFNPAVLVAVAAAVAAAIAALAL